MTASDVDESQELSRSIRQLEDRLAFWKHQGQVIEQMIEYLTARMAIAVDRQKELLKSKAAGA